MTSTSYFSGIPVADLTPGQVLYAVHVSRWGNSIVSIERLTIAKILKTRVVFARPDDRGEVRYIVRDGTTLTNKVEGSGSSYADLYTEDDETLAELRNAHRLEKLRRRANGWTEKFNQKPTLHHADQARKSLNAWMNEAAAQGQRLENPDA